MVCVEPATKNFVAFTNGTKYTVSAWKVHIHFVAVPYRSSMFSKELSSAL